MQWIVNGAQWLVTNVEWLFSGVGLAAIAYIWKRSTKGGDAVVPAIAGGAQTTTVPEESASVLLRVLKNAQAMAHEFSVFERLESLRVTDIQPRTHTLHKIVRNGVASFYQDFQAKSITVRQAPSEVRVNLDYEIFSVAMYYVLENAAKYCAHGSLLNIRFENVSGLKLVLEMTSLQVDESEKERIFSEGYSGRVARSLNMNGNGIGMSQAKKLLSIENINIRFIPGSALQTSIKDAGYAYNTIEIEFSDTHVLADGSVRRNTNARASQ